ncbi:hypothetical protein SETIT_3G048800v2 [Setaria italica]|uniref:Uncharacterized protein n=2 Tax=Setaria TaxID=4554 RepID=A0A368QBR5_SETIT|nr:hypothetical protein SETIT_3G048800v2 [Setaria italica]TKW24409.1 hypothetical protein SEVIR_3G049300v2 [Setaria viridis]
MLSFIRLWVFCFNGKFRTIKTIFRGLPKGSDYWCCNGTRLNLHNYFYLDQMAH